jgi:hypothetical protein
LRGDNKQSLVAFELLREKFDFSQLEFIGGSPPRKSKLGSTEYSKFFRTWATVLNFLPSDENLSRLFVPYTPPVDEKVVEADETSREAITFLKMMGKSSKGAIPYLIVLKSKPPYAHGYMTESVPPQILEWTVEFGITKWIDEIPSEYREEIVDLSDPVGESVTFHRPS